MSRALDATRRGVVAALLESAKREVLEDIDDGVVPEHVASLAELDQYVHASEYGISDVRAESALCDESPDVRDFRAALEIVGAVDEARAQLDAWLKGGRK